VRLPWLLVVEVAAGDRGRRVGAVTVHHDGKVTVTVGSEKAIFDPPAGKDIDAQMVVDLRHMLTKAGYGPS